MFLTKLHYCRFVFVLSVHTLCISINYSCMHGCMQFQPHAKINYYNKKNGCTSTQSVYIITENVCTFTKGATNITIVRYSYKTACTLGFLQLIEQHKVELVRIVGVYPIHWKLQDSLEL